MNASNLLGYTEATRRRPYGFGRWSRGAPQEPPAKQQGLRGGAPGAPYLGGVKEALNGLEASRALTSASHLSRFHQWSTPCMQR
jgi:hypothetical protein